MRTIFLYLLICSSFLKSGNSYATLLTTKSNAVLVGELLNFKGTEAVLYGIDKLSQTTYYKLPVKNGVFSVPDSLIQVPQMVDLRFEDGDRFISCSVLLAPDYRLSLKADATNFKPTLKWSGKGALSNRFNTSMQKCLHSYPQKGEFETWYQNTKSTSDSLFQLNSKVFADKSDKNFDYFKQLISYEIMFGQLNALAQHAFALLDTQSPEAVQEYIFKHCDRKVFENISKDEYLASPVYRYSTGASFWHLFYLFKVDKKIGINTSQSAYEQYLVKIEQTFHDKVKDFVLHKFILINLLSATNSYEEFADRSTQTAPFIEQISNEKYRQELLKSISQKMSELSILKKGDPAPIFSLVDSTNQNFNLTQFKGKVVLLDFWASWCGPCRKETPYLQALYDKYASTGKIEFISIAVRDKENDWKKALKKDQPSWLQLFDSSGKTAANYFTNAIPKFVIIDEKGLILNFDSPAPSLEDKLETILKQKLTEL